MSLKQVVNVLDQVSLQPFVYDNQNEQEYGKRTGIPMNNAVLSKQVIRAIEITILASDDSQESVEEVVEVVEKKVELKNAPKENRMKRSNPIVVRKDVEKVEMLRVSQEPRVPSYLNKNIRELKKHHSPEQSVKAKIVATEKELKSSLINKKEAQVKKQDVIPLKASQFIVDLHPKSNQNKSKDVIFKNFASNDSFNISLSVINQENANDMSDMHDIRELLSHESGFSSEIGSEERSQLMMGQRFSKRRASMTESQNDLVNFINIGSKNREVFRKMELKREEIPEKPKMEQREQVMDQRMKPSVLEGEEEGVTQKDQGKNKKPKNNNKKKGKGKKQTESTEPNAKEIGRKKMKYSISIKQVDEEAESEEFRNNSKKDMGAGEWKRREISYEISKDHGDRNGEYIPSQSDQVKIEYIDVVESAESSEPIPPTVRYDVESKETESREFPLKRAREQSSEPHESIQQESASAIKRRKKRMRKTELERIRRKSRMEKQKQQKDKRMKDSKKNQERKQINLENMNKPLSKEQLRERQREEIEKLRKQHEMKKAEEEEALVEEERRQKEIEKKKEEERRQKEREREEFERKAKKEKEKIEKEMKNNRRKRRREESPDSPSHRSATQSVENKKKKKTTNPKPKPKTQKPKKEKKQKVEKSSSQSSKQPARRGRSVSREQVSSNTDSSSSLNGSFHSIQSKVGGPSTRAGNKNKRQRNATNSRSNSVDRSSSEFASQQRKKENRDTDKSISRSQRSPFKSKLQANLFERRMNQLFGFDANPNVTFSSHDDKDGVLRIFAEMQTSGLLFRSISSNYKSITIETASTRKNIYMLDQSGTKIFPFKNRWTLDGGKKFQMHAGTKSSTNTFFKITLNF